MIVSEDENGDKTNDQGMSDSNQILDHIIVPGK
jgi:hypothetical protein